MLLSQGRARPSRRVVRGSGIIRCACSNFANLLCQVESSDEDEDDDDVNTGRRRKRQKTGGAKLGSCQHAALTLSTSYSVADARQSQREMVPSTSRLLLKLIQKTTSTVASGVEPSPKSIAKGSMPLPRVETLRT